MRLILVVVLLALVCRWGVAQVGPRYVVEVPGTAAAAAAAVASQGSVQLAGKGLVLIHFQGLSILVVEADAEAYCQEAAADWPAADLLLLLPASAGRYDGLAPLRALRDGMAVIVPEPASRGAADGVASTGAQGVATAGVVAGGIGGAATSLPSGPRLYPMQPWNTLELRKQAARLRVTAMPGRPGTAALAGYLLEVGNTRASYRVYAGGTEDETAQLAQRLPGADLALVPGAAPGSTQLLALNRGMPAKTPPAALTAAGYAFKAMKR